MATLPASDSFIALRAVTVRPTWGAREHRRWDRLVENRLHYVRDFTYDEDRCRAYVRHLPRNLACLTNVAIAIVRCNGRFRYLPEANRHYAARAQEALDAILIAPIA